MVHSVLLCLVAASQIVNGLSGIDLYNAGMFERARSVFESQADGPISDGYELLCAYALGSEDTQRLLDAYESKYGLTALSSSIYLHQGFELFDKQRYGLAGMYLSKVSDIPREYQSEFYYKRAYSYFAHGFYTEAGEFFGKVIDGPVSDYTAPAEYQMGIMAYNSEDYSKAQSYFEHSSNDPRFKEISEFYILECRFHAKDYRYVVQTGPVLSESAPKERQERIARFISESSLVLGDMEMAKEYFDLSSRENMSRTDFFYAGSLLYAIEDYQGAIENFTAMGSERDSLAQTAQYQLANSYLRVRNRVGAFESFRNASEMEFDSRIQEDAMFNYAKLAFDLNQDGSGFEKYIRTYSTSRRGEQIYGYMALAALIRHDYAAAVDAYDRIDELDPLQRGNYMKANFLRGEQLYSAGAYRDAIPCFRAASFYLPKTDRFNQLSRYYLAESQYKTRSYADAAKTYADLYNMSALYGSAEADLLQYNVAFSYFNAGDCVTAARWFDSFIAAQAANAALKAYVIDATVRRADCDFESNGYEQAITSYTAAAAYTDELGLYPMYRKALCYGLLGKKKEKVSCLNGITLERSDDPLYEECLYELGRGYEDLKNHKSATAAFERLRTQSSDSVNVAKAIIGLGMVCRNQKDYDGALGHYKHVVSMMYGSELANDALLAIESIYQAKKQPQKYIAYLESLKLDREKSDEEKEIMYFGAAEQLYVAANYTDAIDAAGKYLEQYPQGAKVPDALFYVAESHRMLGEKELACDWYKKVFEYRDCLYFEGALLQFANLSYSLEHYPDAYQAYSQLLSCAKLDGNAQTAREGMMRSAYRARDYENAIGAANLVLSAQQTGNDLRRETDYVVAKSYMATSRREQALEIMKRLSADPSTPEGAESAYLIIKDEFDRAKFDDVEKSVYDFSNNFGDQSYYLAKAFIVLGDSFVERGLSDQARATFESVRDGYVPSGPDDDVPSEIAQRLSKFEQQ